MKIVPIFSTNLDTTHTNMLDYDAVVKSVIRDLKSICIPSDKIWITDPSKVIHDQFRERISDKEVQCCVNENYVIYIKEILNVFVSGYVSNVLFMYQQVLRMPKK